MSANVTTREVGPFKIVSNGRTVGTADTRKRAERKAPVGAVIVGRTVFVAEFGR